MPARWTEPEGTLTEMSASRAPKPNSRRCGAACATSGGCSIGGAPSQPPTRHRPDADPLAVPVEADRPLHLGTARVERAEGRDQAQVAAGGVVAGGVEGHHVHDHVDGGAGKDL